MSQVYPQNAGQPAPLYELLPSIFRQMDIGQGYPLLALMTVFDSVRSQLSAAVAELENEWFIQTCPLELVPSIGGLVGLEIPKPVRPEHRALVADALALRRRKGIAAALPRLIRDASGWYALYAPDAQTPAWSWPLPPASGAPVLLPASAPGLPSPTPVGTLRVWRLPAFAVVGATPAPGSSLRHYWFNPLGLAQPLCNLPVTPLGWAAAPPVTALPAPVSVAMLQDDLAHYRQLWPDPSLGPPDSLLYGPGRGLVVRSQAESGADWSCVPPGSVRATQLPGGAPVPPDYPVRFGGAINTAALAAGISALTLTFGDAHAALQIAIPVAPTMPALVGALQAALAAAPVTPGSEVSEADVRAIEAGAVGNALVLVPGRAAAQPLSLAPTTAGSGDPLLLTGSAVQGIAAATTWLTPTLIAQLTDAPAGSELVFAAPAGQALAVPLPLVLATPDAAGVAAAFAAALPTCFVCAADGQVVTVPPPPATAPPTPPAASPLCWELGLAPALALDPEAGAFAWPSAWPLPVALSVDFGVAMAAPLGGAGPGLSLPIPPTADAPTDTGSAGWLEQELSAWATSTAAETILLLQGSSSRILTTQTLAPAAGQTLRIVAASGSQAFLPATAPVLLTLQGPATSGQPGTIGLAGLVMQAGLSLPGGGLGLTLRDSTLIPPAGTAAIAADLAPPSGTAPAATGAIALVATRCLLGAVDLTGFTGSFSIADTVLSTLPAPDLGASVLLTSADLRAQLDRVTLLGTARTQGKVAATDSLFAGALTCTGQVQLSYCYVADLGYLGPGSAPNPATDTAPAAASVTRCTTCGKLRAIRLQACVAQRLALDPARDPFCTCDAPADGPPTDCTTCADPACAPTCPLKAPGQSWQPVGGAPVFMQPNRYPLPNFARLANDNPRDILYGASNRDVLGADNIAAPSARATQLDEALRDNLLFGKGLDVVYES